MRIFMMILCFVLISTLAFAGVRRFDPDKKDLRQTVEVIDAGDIAGTGKKSTYVFHDFTLTCVDGMKVYTVIKENAIDAVTLPGGCDGKPAQRSGNNKPAQRSGNNKVNW